MKPAIPGPISHAAPPLDGLRRLPLLDLAIEPERLAVELGQGGVIVRVGVGVLVGVVRAGAQCVRVRVGGVGGGVRRAGGCGVRMASLRNSPRTWPGSSNRAPA